MRKLLVLLAEKREARERLRASILTGSTRLGVRNEAVAGNTAWKKALDNFSIMI